MEQIRKFFRGDIKTIDEESKSLYAVISSVDEDRDGDIILPSSMKASLAGYMKHPVLLADHNYYDLRKQIGVAVDIQVNEKDVVAKFQYLVGKGNEEADYAWELAKLGIAAYSIGFIAKDWEAIEKVIDGHQYVTGRKFTNIELMEVSQVLIPSNRSALQASADLCEMACKSLKDGKLKMPELKVEKKEVKEEPKAEKKEDAPHYTETILGKEVLSTVSEPDKVAIAEAVKQSLKESFKA